MYHEEYLCAHPRSTFRAIAPRGEGEMTESLTSYVGRVAWHHSVKPALLISSTIDVGKSSGFLKSEVATCFNSLTSKSGAIVQKVSELVGLPVETVAAMTLMHLHDYVDHSARGLIRKKKQWCPKCYHEDDSSGERFDRLAWSLERVSHCSEHKCKLRDFCHHCLESQPYLSTKVPVGYCHYCQKSLSESFYVVCGEEEYEQSLVFCSLVSGLNRPPPEVSEEHLISELRRLVLLFSDEGVPRLARYLKIDRHCMERWLSGETKPAVSSMEKVFGHFGLPWADILVGRTGVIEAQKRTKHRRLRPNRKNIKTCPRGELRVVDGEVLGKEEPSLKQLRRAHSIEQINRYLDAILNGEMVPHSRSKIASSLGVSVGYLESLFGMKVRRVSDLYKEYRDGLSLTRSEQLREAIQAAVLATIEEGEAPSWKNVTSHLPEDLQKRHSMAEMSRIRVEVLASLWGEANDAMAS